MSPGKNVKKWLSGFYQHDNFAKLCHNIPETENATPPHWVSRQRHDFKNGRQLAAWLGLTPGRHRSGGKSKLGGITKAGDRRPNTASYRHLGKRLY